MKNILIVKANNRPDGVSTKMFEVFNTEISKNESLEVEVLDLFEENIPHFGQDLFNAFGKTQNGDQLMELEAKSLQTMKKFQDAFTKADVIVYAFPLWNLTIPSVLKAFFDYVTMSGFTFKYNAQGQIEYLQADKKVIILCARGSVFTGAREAEEMAANLVRNIVKNLHGMEVIDEVIIEGHNQLPAQAAQIKEEGLKAVEEAAAKLAAVYA